MSYSLLKQYAFNPNHKSLAAQPLDIAKEQSSVLSYKQQKVTP